MPGTALRAVGSGIIGSFSSDYEYEIRQAKCMLYAYAIPY
jgi:hypothetical protein